MAVTCHLSTAHGVSVDISSYELNMEESLEFFVQGIVGNTIFQGKGKKKKGLLREEFIRQ